MGDRSWHLTVLLWEKGSLAAIRGGVRFILAHLVNYPWNTDMLLVRELYLTNREPHLARACGMAKSRDVATTKQEHLE
jgi:hypothetical protein